MVNNFVVEAGINDAFSLYELMIFFLFRVINHESPLRISHHWVIKHRGYIVVQLFLWCQGVGGGVSITILSPDTGGKSGLFCAQTPSGSSIVETVVIFTNFFIAFIFFDVQLTIANIKNK